jgi:hypothetical protein
VEEFGVVRSILHKSKTLLEFSNLKKVQKRRTEELSNHDLYGVRKHNECLVALTTFIEDVREKE